MPRSVLGFFAMEPEARQAASRLREAGFQDVSVDHVERYPGDGIQQRMNPGTGRMSGLADLVLNASIGPDSEAGPLLANSTSASGMTPYPNGVTGRNFMVTAVVDSDEEAERAAELLRQAGGMG
ncbi:MAG: hypothetical protein IMW99_02885 [Firmicutes bacterium]|nr:hypothetical protein [Bacillota bacterium]